MNESVVSNILRQIRELRSTLERLNARDGRAFVAAPSSSAPPTWLVIASGSVTPTSTYHFLSPEGIVADDLTNIAIMPDGYMFTMRKGDSLVNITIKHMTGNIHLIGGTDFLLNTEYKMLTVVYDDILDLWLEVSRAE